MTDASTKASLAAAEHARSDEKPKHAKALVIADDIGIFLAVVRSLGRADIKVDVATCGENYPGLASRFISHVHVLPPYLSEPSAWIDRLQELVKRENYGLVIPTSDSSLDLLARAATSENAERLAVPSPKALELLSSKSLTRDLAQTNGINICAGRTLIASPDAIATLADIPYPMVVKPSQPYLTGGSEAKTSVMLIDSLAELKQSMTDFAGREIVIEQFFEGHGTGLSVLADEGEVKLAWQHRRLAQTGTTGRSSQRTGCEPEDLLIRDVRILCRATRLTGVAMFEFRQNPKTGAHVLLEVNPRFWGSLPLALAAGADFPFGLWCVLTGQTDGITSSCHDFTIHKSSLLAEIDRLSEGATGRRKAIRKSTATSRLLAKALFTPSQFDSWSEDDPAPHWKELALIAKRLRDALQNRLT